MNSVWVKKHLFKAIVVFGVVLNLYSSVALATGSGRNGNDSSGSGATCATCHSSNTYSSGNNLVFNISGTTNVGLGGSLPLTLRISNSPATADNGFSATVRNNGGSTRYGSFSTTDTSDVKTGTAVSANDYVTHPSPRANGTTFSFTWIAPTTAISGLRLYTCVNQVGGNLDNITSNDGPPRCGNRAINVVNLAPVANPDAKSVNENSTTTIQVKNNNGSGADNDGDVVVQTLSVSSVNRSGSSGNGSVTELGTDGLLFYDPRNRFDYLDFNDSEDDVFNYTLSDGSITDIGTVTITVTGVNDAPQVVNTIASPNLTYTEVQPPVALVIDNGVAVSDVDNGATINRAEVQMTTNFDGAQDELSCGTAVAGITCSAFNAGTGLLALTGNASIASYQLALRRVRYVNNSLNPTENTRTVTYRVRDDRNAYSTTDTATVTVAAVSFPPQVANFTSNPTTTFVENGSVVVDGSVTLSDSDSALLNQAVLMLTNIQTGDSLVCPGGGSLAAGMSCAYLAPTLTISSAGNILSEYETAIEAVAFTNSLDNPNAVNRNVTLTVRDNDNTNSTPASSKVIEITVVNDPPTITLPFAGTTATENSGYSYTPTVTDPDNSAVDFTFAISGAPSGSTFSTTTGTFNWTPPRTNTFNDAIATITISVEDLNEDASAPPNSVDINLIVSPPDGDGDGVATYADNCPTVGNGIAGDNQADNDLDTVRILPQTDSSGIPVLGDVDQSDPLTGGDSCDTDDDNDGLSDIDENFYSGPPCFLSSTDPTDATQDCDGDGLDNLTEINDGNPATDVAVDSVGPTITVPADVTVNSTGHLTMVDIGVATANDGNEGIISTVIPVVDGSITCGELGSTPDTIDPLRPGSYTVTWHSCDSESNLSAVDQSVTVVPLITTTSGQVTSIPDPLSLSATILRFEVMLNGPIAVDVDVDFAITGSVIAGVDYAIFGDPVATGGTITVASGDTIAFADIDILDQGVAEFAKTFSLVLSNPVNAALGAVINQEVLIGGEDYIIPPVVDISVVQNSENVGSTITIGNGDATLTANAFDPNDDTLFYDWSMSDAALLAQAGAPPYDNSTLVVDAAMLSTGLYPVEVSVTDGGDTTIRSMLLVAQVGGAVVLPTNIDTDGDGLDDDDPLEGLGDEDGDGIPNYLDNLFLAPNVINNQTGDLGNSFIIQTDPGLDIRKGTTAVAAGVAGVLISQAQLEANGGQAGGVATNAVDSNPNTSGFYDFEVSGLNPSIRFANIVIPLPSALRANSVYRKYNTIDGWFSFVQDGNNRVSSATGELGICPAPGSALYTSGLSQFHFCVQLTIEDGGPNDADKTRDFVIRDPGGVVVQPASEKKKSDSDGRIGVMHPLLLLIMLLPFAYAYRKEIRREYVRIVRKKKQ